MNARDNTPLRTLIADRLAAGEDTAAGIAQAGAGARGLRHAPPIGHDGHPVGDLERADRHKVGEPQEWGEATVKTHLAHVYEKLDVGDRASAVRTAWERGLV